MAVSLRRSVVSRPVVCVRILLQMDFYIIANTKLEFSAMTFFETVRSTKPFAKSGMLRSFTLSKYR